MCYILIGNFVRLRALKNGSAYNLCVNFTRSINLISAGDFILTIYTFIYCPKLNCDAGDSFTIKVKENDVDGYQEIFRTGTTSGRIRDNQWKKETVYFKSSFADIFVI